MTATKRQGFTRLETDAELLSRTREKIGIPTYSPMSGEPIDAFAERYGLQRRIVEDKS